MKNWQIKVSLFLNYFVFAILLNSVGTVILQVQNNFDVSKSSASILEACKDLSIALFSFLVASYITRLGYKRSMLIALGLVSVACFIMPSLSSFAMTKVLFMVVGASFALIKMSVYGTIGLITSDEKEHISFMSFIEGFFMIGILTGNFVFSLYVDDNNPKSLEWFKIYYLLGGLSLVALFLLWSAPLDETTAKSPAKKDLVTEFSEMFKLLVIPLVLVFVLCAFFYVLIEQSIMSWLPTFNKEVLKLPTSISIQMAIILPASTAIGRFLAGIVLQKIDWFVALTGCLIAAAGLVLLAIPLAQGIDASQATGWGNMPVAAYIFPMIGLLLAPIYPAINSLILNKLPIQKHGLMSGLIIVFSALGGTTGSLITGNIFQHFGGENAFYFSLIPITILITGLYFFKRLQKA
jgi:MFS transporter, FHS family, glucose/mannose:H+ symporter